MRITDPLNGSARCQTQQPFDPEEVLLRATATELGIKVNLLHSYSACLSIHLDVLDSALLARTNDLKLIEQEHWNPRGCDELVDLGPAAAELGLGPTIHRGLTDAMCLVQDQGIEAVGLGPHE